MDRPAWLETSDLVTPVRRLLETERVEPADWTVEPLTGGAGEALGVWRVTGEAAVDAATSPFALILKGWRARDDRDDPAAWDWPWRELRACASGTLDHLPGGIAAPRCLGEVSRADGTTWAWMTPMSTGALVGWDREHFALVARRLGRFNGAYLAGTPVPDAAWLSRGWTRGWTEAAADTIASIDRHSDHPLIARTMPPEHRREIGRLFAERSRWFDALDALPQTFAHLDAFPRNIFLRPGPGGTLEPGLIDWSYAGIAAVGEEIAPLVSASVVFGEAGGLTLLDLDATVFPAYLAGLRDAGWDGDERAARMGYTGSLVMRYVLGPLRQAVPLLLHENLHPVVERIFGMPVDGLADATRTHNAWALARAEEFRRLAAGMHILPDAA